MPKEFLKKLAEESIKKNAGTVQTKQETERIKESLSGFTTEKDVSKIKERIKNLKNTEDSVKGSTAGAVGEAVAGSALTEIEKNRLKDAMPDYASGGEVVVGKGKDYIKDLL